MLAHQQTFRVGGFECAKKGIHSTPSQLSQYAGHDDELKEVVAELERVGTIRCLSLIHI